MVDLKAFSGLVALGSNKNSQEASTLQRHPYFKEIQAIREDVTKEVIEKLRQKGEKEETKVVMVQKKDELASLIQFLYE